MGFIALTRVCGAMQDTTGVPPHGHGCERALQPPHGLFKQGALELRHPGGEALRAGFVTLLHHDSSVSCERAKLMSGLVSTSLM